MNREKKINLKYVEKISRKYLILTFIIFSLSILATGFYVYQSYSEDIKQKVIDELTSVSNLKVQEISHWRHERIKNLSTIQNEVFGNRVKRTLENPDNMQIQNELLNWFLKFRNNYGYDRICLHDLKGKERMMTSETEVEMPYPLESYYSRLFEKKEIVFEDFYFDKIQKKIYLPLLVGMFDFKDQMKPLGTIITRVDPSEYIYPLLDKWPIPRKTAKIHLMRKEGQKVVFLNNTSENRHFELDNHYLIENHNNLPSVKAVQGYSGIYESLDFKKEPVITYIQSIPETNWKMISKINKSEAMQPVKGILSGIITVVSLLIILLAVVVIFINRYKRYSYYKEIAKNVKALKESEEKIKRLNLTLEQKVKNRTIQLEDANKELESFSYSVSHDLRAPLRHILAFTDILKNDLTEFDEKSKDTFSKITGSAEEMGLLIDNLLEYSKTGRMKLDIIKVKMDHIVKDVLENLKAETKMTDIECIVSKLPAVYCDESLLKSVWENLIENSLKFTSKQKRPVIEIGHEQKDKEFVFYIKDNGVGFDMGSSAKLFGVFQRLHLNKDFPGTGIGLANVRRIISRHGGRTWAEGKVHEGAKFYFSLPESQYH